MWPLFPRSYTCVWAQMELDKSTLQVALVKLICHPRLWPLFKSPDEWQLVKSTCQVNLQGNPPKITLASCPKIPPRGVLGGGGRSRSCQKKMSESITSWYFCINLSVEMIFLNYFWIFSTTRGHIATWQCYCVIGKCSATICIEYLRWDMPLIIDCVLLPLHSHVLLILFSLFVGSDRGFVYRKFLWAYFFWGQWCVCF